MVHRWLFLLVGFVMARHVPDFLAGWKNTQMQKFKRFFRSAMGLRLSCDEEKCRAVGTCRNCHLARAEPGCLDEIKRIRMCAQSRTSHGEHRSFSNRSRVLGSPIITSLSMTRVTADRLFQRLTSSLYAPESARISLFSNAMPLHCKNS
jgi:hypothetical protein